MPLKCDDRECNLMALEDGHAVAGSACTLRLGRSAEHAPRAREPRSVWSGSSVRQDGARVSLTAPNGTSQAAVVRVTEGLRAAVEVSRAAISAVWSAAVAAWWSAVPEAGSRRPTFYAMLPCTLEGIDILFYELS